MKKSGLFILAIFFLFFTACDKDEPVKDTVDPDPDPTDTIKEVTKLTFIMDASDTMILEPESSGTKSFLGGGIESIDFEVPLGWSASSEMETEESGHITITSPALDSESDGYDEEGVVVIIVSGEDDQEIRTDLPVRMNFSNYTSVHFVDIVEGLSLEAVTLLMSDGESSESFTSSGEDDSFVFEFSEDYSLLIEGEFETSEGVFTYYFPPATEIDAEESEITISIKAPELFSYWQGGLLMKIEEEKNGVDAYHISGTLVALQESPEKLMWHHVGEINIPGTKNDDDGLGNTEAILDFQGEADPDNGRAVNTAARWCRWNKWGGFDDWYLPAINELKEVIDIYLDNQEMVDEVVLNMDGNVFNNTSYDSYWSSTENSAKHAKFLYRENGNIDLFGTKTYGVGVLAMRKF